jgi:hypothetical protein
VRIQNVILTQTLNLTFLYVTVSTLNPTVGIVVTDWPNFNLYKIAEKFVKENRVHVFLRQKHTLPDSVNITGRHQQIPFTKHFSIGQCSYRCDYSCFSTQANLITHQYTNKNKNIQGGSNMTGTNESSRSYLNHLVHIYNVINTHTHTQHMWWNKKRQQTTTTNNLSYSLPLTFHSVDTQLSRPVDLCP